MLAKQAWAVHADLLISTICLVTKLVILLASIVLKKFTVYIFGA